MEPTVKQRAKVIYATLKRSCGIPPDIGRAIMGLSIDPKHALFDPKTPIELFSLIKPRIAYADIVSENSNGEIPLHVHTAAKNYEIVRFLLDVEDERVDLLSEGLIPTVFPSNLSGVQFIQGFAKPKQIFWRDKKDLTPIERTFDADDAEMFKLFWKSPKVKAAFLLDKLLPAAVENNSENILDFLCQEDFNKYKETCTDPLKIQRANRAHLINSAISPNTFKSIRCLRKRNLINDGDINAMFIGSGKLLLINLFFDSGIAIPSDVLPNAVKERDFEKIKLLANKLQRKNEIFLGAIQDDDVDMMEGLHRTEMSITTPIITAIAIPNDALHKAVQYESFKALNWIINKKGKDSINKKDDTGCTPLHYAAQPNKGLFALPRDLYMTGLLWHKGGSLRVENAKKETPLSIWKSRLPEVYINLCCFAGVGLVSK